MKHTISETCKDLLAQLSSFLEGELDEAVCRQIEQHLAACPYCRVTIDTVKKTIVLYHEAPRDEVPRDVHARLVKVLELEAVTKRSDERQGP